MAKKGKSGSKPKVVPEVSDALRLATLRWFTTTIERLLIEVYVTNPGKYQELETLMKSQVRQIEMFGKKASIAEPDDCPPGWKLCPDGLCAPMCGGMIEST